MLTAFLLSESPAYLATYTRNPAIVRMLAAVCGRHNVFPLCQDAALRDIAREMPNASPVAVGNIYPLYHHKRYGTGLYLMDKDPAAQPIDRGGITLIQAYPALQHPGTALVVTARASNEVK